MGFGWLVVDINTNRTPSFDVVIEESLGFQRLR